MDELTNDQVLRLLFQKIRQRMRSGHMRKNALPASLKQLIDTVATAARIDVPAVLVEYATHGIVSHSLKFDTLQRIHGAAAKADTQAELLEQKDDAAIDAQEMITANSNPDDLEPEWLQQLRASLRTKDASQAVAALEALLATFPSPACPGHRITDFAHYLLTERHQDQRRFVARKRLAISTVQSWTLTVARRFGRILGDQDPVALTTENIETLYTQVLENVVEGDDSRRLGRTVAQALREFQEFLVGKLEVAPIHDREILGSSGGLLPVDAKILTLEQYSEARRSIRQKSHHEYDAKLLHATEALLIFGFRFGTRRMEAYGLELPDLAGEPTAWLLVRPTEGRQLKTDNAKRQLPLRSLIPEDELEVLDSWKQARIQNRTDGRPNECLSFFAAPQLNENGVVVQTPFPVRKMITLLHEAIRNATGDNTLHFHHLRHSFATWTFLRLMISDLPRIPDLFPHLPETTAWLREAKDFREQLYGTPHPTRKHAMAVASLLGHSGPGVSLEHYIHCLDWLLPLFLAESPLLRVPSVNRVAIASAYPKSNLNNWNQYLGSSSLSGQIFKKRFPGLAATPNANSAHVASPGPIDSGSQRWLWNTWNLLFLEGTTREPLDELADRLGFDLETAELILARAKAIQQIREPEGRKSVRHEMETVAVDRRNPGEKIVIACPKRCNDQGTQEVIEGIEPKLWTMANRPDVDSVQRVLGYFVQNSWLTLNVLPFRNPDQPEDAILYRKFLSDLDIPDSRIRFVSFDQRKRSRSRRKWKNAFKTDKALQEKIRIQKPPFVASSASDRWLGIEPDSARNGPAQKQHGLVGFRFLLVMAAIRFGYAGEEQ
jgi:integrase